MNTIEERLWNYIDGTCSADEQKAIDMLIAQDEVYRRKYEELVNLNQQFSKMELEEPSMAFTYNVMEGIRAEHALKPLKAGINKKIIRSITIFFVVSILLMVILTLSNLHLSTATSTGQLVGSMKLPDLKNYFTAPVIKGFLFFDVVLGLFLFDAYLRKKSVSKQL
jgi:hypothetical protein